MAIIGAILSIVVCLWILRAALAPFFAAVVVAYLLWPAFCLLGKRVGKVLSAVIVISFGLAVGAVAVWVMFAVFDEQIKRIIATFPHWKEALEIKLIPQLQENPQIILKLQSAFEDFDSMLFLRGISGASLGVLGWLLQALSFALVPLIAYYLLIDGPKWLESLESVVPERFRPGIRDVAYEINQRLGGFIRGELLVIASMSVLHGISFALLGVPYAWLLGLIAGISNIVPYSPYVTALPLAILLVALEGAGWGWISAIAITFFMVQKAEGFYFTPVWVGRASKLHPVEVLMALLCFGFAFGVLGLIFAIPLMIICKVIGKKMLELYRAQPWFDSHSK